MIFSHRLKLQWHCFETELTLKELNLR